MLFWLAGVVLDMHPACPEALTALVVHDLTSRFTGSHRSPDTSFAYEQVGAWGVFLLIKDNPLHAARTKSNIRSSAVL